MPARKIADLVDDRIRQPGTVTFGPAVIDSDISWLVCTVHRKGWETLRETELAGVMIEISYDGGTTWEGLIGCGVGGGRVFNGFGVEVFTSSCRRDVGEEKLVPRLLRGRWTQDERLRVSIDVDLGV